MLPNKTDTRPEVRQVLFWNKITFGGGSQVIRSQRPHGISCVRARIAAIIRTRAAIRCDASGAKIRSSTWWRQKLRISGRHVEFSIRDTARPHVIFFYFRHFRGVYDAAIHKEQIVEHDVARHYDHDMIAFLDAANLGGGDLVDFSQTQPLSSHAAARTSPPRTRNRAGSTTATHIGIALTRRVFASL